MEILNYGRINRDVLRTIEKPSKRYFFWLMLPFSALALGFSAWLYQVYYGLGVAGITHPVMWGIYIVNFVFWVGIAHSGTLISAILFLVRARWRTAVYRAAEIMTLFAIMTAGLYPLIHLGRPWYFYWILPYPNQRWQWPNFKSPLTWDVFAIMTYLIISSTFLYLGLIPDIATIRDRAKGVWRKFYGILSLGWQGTDEQWRHFGSAYLFLAALATPLVVSVHSVVSWDFAMAIVPGWHSTIFAPYFVAGAIHSGLAMVITLMVPMRRIFGLYDYITTKHFDNLAKVIVFTGLIMGYSYLTEHFIAWYSANPFEMETFRYRAIGDYWPEFWIMVVFNSLVPLAFFFKKVRTNIVSLLVIALLINVGMWFERFVIIVTSLGHEFIPYAWGLYRPSPVELSVMAGTFGFFFLLFLAFIKIFPAVSICEMKEHLPLHIEVSSGR